MTGWIADARRIELRQVAVELDLQFAGSTHLFPCPACGEIQRSKKDDRKGPVYLTKQGQAWRCSLCDAGGSTIDLVGHALRIGPVTPEARAWWAARGWCTAAPDAPEAPRVKPRPPPPVEAPPAPLPRDEVEGLWGRCTRVTDDQEVVAWLVSRGLDVETVAGRDLCRVLPIEGALPTWARHWRGTRHVCPVLVPLFSHEGALVGLQGRRIDGQSPKSVAAAGHARQGAYADLTARSVLEAGGRPDWWTGNLVIVTEGEPDFLSWAAWGDESEGAPAVLGFPGAGGWDEDVGARVPDDAVVVIRAHPDKDGQRFAAAIADQLGGRCDVRITAAEAA